MVRNFRVDEFYSPEDNAPDCALAHIPSKVAEKGESLNIISDVIGAGEIDSVLLYTDRISFWNDENPFLKLEKTGNFRYETSVPSEWLEGKVLKYNLVVFTGGKAFTYPDKVEGMPLDWDFTDYGYYEVPLADKASEILIYNPYTQNTGLEYYCIPDWGVEGDKE